MIKTKNVLLCYSLLGYIFVSQIFAQSNDLILQNITINESVNYSAKQSISVGPEVTIAKNGDVTLISKLTIIHPSFFIIQGGQLNIISSSTVEVLQNKFTLLSDLKLFQNYPNPFNPVTKLNYALPKGNNVNISVYNMAGQKVKTLISNYQEPGTYTILWDGSDNYGNKVGNGIYMCVMVAGNQRFNKKMILMK